MFIRFIFCLGIAVLLRVTAVSCVWTRWYNRDAPAPPGSGDWEDLHSIRDENPGEVCEKPFAIEARLMDGSSYEAAHEAVTISERLGFYCINDLQVDGMCQNYQVRFDCERCEWTEWFDRDDPTGNVDNETLANLRLGNDGVICEHPSAIAAKVVSDATSTGGNVFAMSADTGLLCSNIAQMAGNSCKDYAVRFYCCKR